MFLFWRMIVLAVALAAVLYGIGRSRIRAQADRCGAGGCIVSAGDDGFRHVSGGESGDVLPLAGRMYFLIWNRVKFWTCSKGMPPAP